MLFITVFRSDITPLIGCCFQHTLTTHWCVRLARVDWQTQQAWPWVITASRCIVSQWKGFIRVQQFETGRCKERGLKWGWLVGSQTSDIYRTVFLTTPQVCSAVHYVCVCLCIYILRCLGAGVWVCVFSLPCAGVAHSRGTRPTPLPLGICTQPIKRKRKKRSKTPQVWVCILRTSFSLNTTDQHLLYVFQYEFS